MISENPTKKNSQKVKEEEEEEIKSYLWTKSCRVVWKKFLAYPSYNSLNTETH